MYTLPYYQDARLQQIISKEILNGFNFAFGMNNETHEADPIEAQIIMFDSNADNNDQRAYAKAYAEALYKEIADPDAEYQFSPFGERILYNAIKGTKEIMTEILRLPHMSKANKEKRIFYKWNSSLSKEEKEYVLKTAGEFIEDSDYDDYRQDLKREHPRYTNDHIEKIIQNERGQDIYTFCRQCTCFPFMADEIDGDSIYEILFSDTDFLLIDDFGLKYFNEFQNSDAGKMLGIAKPSGTFTGSTRIPLKKDE